MAMMTSVQTWTADTRTYRPEQQGVGGRPSSALGPVALLSAAALRLLLHRPAVTPRDSTGTVGPGRKPLFPVTSL